MDVTIEQRGPRGSEVSPERFWDESGPRAKYMAVSDACWLYQDLELEQNLRKRDWRKARKRVLGYGHVKRGWVGRGRGDLRLGRKGLEMRFADGPCVVGWKELQDFIRARRS